MVNIDSGRIMDWTDSYDRNKLADYAEKMVKEIIFEIHSIKLPVHAENNLTTKELCMLYRWPLYVGVNTFMERLIRTLYNFDKGLKGRYDGGKYKPVYIVFQGCFQNILGTNNICLYCFQG